MPLLDHSHPPLIRTHPWRSFHSAWAAAMARLLNAGGLPPGYYALPSVDRDGPFEIDVAALQRADTTEANGEAGLWTPPEPAVDVAGDWDGADDVSVDIFSEEGDPPLVAAIELVSPRNKDRATARESFAAKCVAHLNRGCGVVVVAAATTRLANLHADLFTAVGAELPAQIPAGISAVSYRSLGGDPTGQLQAWPFKLEIGERLPTLPLWLGMRPVPLDLEASYSAACVDLRIRDAG